MAAESPLNLKHIIDILKGDDSRCIMHWQQVKLYEVEAMEFLSFAKEDLEEDSERGKINALSNAKRAIECRMDEILWLFNLKGFCSRQGLNLPQKILFLRTLSVTVPNVLRNLITSKRNLLEHEYTTPERQEVQNIVDIAELFLKATDQHVERGYIASATINLPDKDALPASAELHEELLEHLKSRRLIRSTAKKVQLFSANTISEYALMFDLDNEQITLVHSEQKSWEVSLKDGTLVSWDRPQVNRRLDTLPLRDCAMEEVRELMVLLREKAK